MQPASCSPTVTVDEFPKQQVCLDPAVHFCREHIEPFMDEGGGDPRVLIALVRLYDAALKDPWIAFWTKHRDPTALDTVLRLKAPLCCHIPPSWLSLIYAEAGVEP
jgi:hypothetical protein